MAWLGKGILAILSWIGPVVLRAWAYVLRDEVGKFYAKFRPAFIAGVQEAALITKADIPDLWGRIKAQHAVVVEHLRPVLAEAGENIDDVGMNLVRTGIEAAVAEVKGGWVK